VEVESGAQILSIVLISCWLQRLVESQSLNFKFFIPARLFRFAWILADRPVLSVFFGPMAKKKIKASVKDDVTVVEEVSKTFGVAGEPINGHSKLVGHSSDSGVSAGAPLKAKATPVERVAKAPLKAKATPVERVAEAPLKARSTPVDIVKRDDSHGFNGSERQLQESDLKKVKEPDSRENFEGEAQSVDKEEGRLPVQEGPRNNITVSPVCSHTVEESVKPVSEDTPVPVHNSDGPKAPWVNLFKANRNPSKGFSLQYLEDLPEIPEVKKEHALDVHTVWGYSLVGYFAGRFPGKAALLKLCDSWRVKYKYSAHSSGWLLFQFDNESSRDSVMDGGPYTVFGRPLMLKAMPPFFEFDDQNVSFMPVWVNLPALPLECWTSAALSIICSKIGKPISTDAITATRGQFSYARVLIEIDASKDLVKSVPFKLPSGKLRMQPVQFEFEPRFCTHCKVFGHSVKGCKVIEPDQEEKKTADVNSSLEKKEDSSEKAAEGKVTEVINQPSGCLKQSVPVMPVDPGPSDQSIANDTGLCAGIIEDQPKQMNVGVDGQPNQDDRPPNQQAPDKLGAPFVEVTHKKKKRIQKHVPSEESHEGDEQGGSRRAKQKGEQGEAAKAVSTNQKVIKKGASPHKSR